MEYIVVSMYTKDTFYEKEAKNLERSLKQFKIPYKIYPIENLGSWEKNCQQKAIVILDALESQDKAVVWIDADAEVFQNPVFFDTVSTDCSFYRTFRTDKEGRHDLMSGTMYLGNNEKVKTLVREWIELNKTNAKFDQLNLRNTLLNHPEITVSPLPQTYIKVAARNGRVGKCVIGHYQASRKIREGKESVDK